MQYLDALCKEGRFVRAREHGHPLQFGAPRRPLAGKLLPLTLLILLGGGFAMSMKEVCSKETLLIAGIVLKLAAGLLGRPFWVFAVSLRLVAVAWISAVGT
jgi:hypothetical protein